MVRDYWYIHEGRQVRLIWKLLSRTGPLLWRAIIRGQSREGTKPTSDWASCKVIFIFANSSDSHINCVIETFFYSHFVVEETKFEQRQYMNLPRTHIYQSKELRLMWSKLQTAFTPITTCWLLAKHMPVPGNHQQVNGSLYAWCQTVPLVQKCLHTCGRHYSRCY